MITDNSNIATLQVGTSSSKSGACVDVDIIQDAAKDSINVFFNYYVDEALKKFDYSQLQILKLIRRGECTDIRREAGSENRCGFTIALKFGGESSACHVRGWFDKATNNILVADIFKSEILSV
jgi:hypothetical protein